MLLLMLPSDDVVVVDVIVDVVVDAVVVHVIVIDVGGCC